MKSGTARRGAVRVALLVFVLSACVWDLTRAPSEQISARALLGAIDAYQSTLSGRLAGVTCRFEPTCSYYAEGAIRRYGALRGSGRALARIARCGPWTEPGTVDPP